MLGPSPAARARSRASLAFAVVVTAVGGSVLLSSGTSSSAAPASVVRPMGPAVPAPAVRPLLVSGPSLALPATARPSAPVGPSAAVPRPVGPPTTVGPGSRPRQVRQVQRLLNARGAGLAVDGAWGPATTRAVRGLQLQSGLPPTGRVDPRTAAALRALVRG